MRSVLFIALSLTLACTSAAYAVDDPAVPPVPGTTEVTPVAPVERPKPAEKPRPIEKPKLIETPRVVPENTGSTFNPAPSTPPAKAVETVAPVSAFTPATSPGHSTDSFGCLALAFAMLIVGIGAGFLGRHLMSRHKLGGMTVRIGTWRGIP